jgi:hypothetical protein
MFKFNLNPLYNHIQNTVDYKQYSYQFNIIHYSVCILNKYSLLIVFWYIFHRQLATLLNAFSLLLANTYLHAGSWACVLHVLSLWLGYKWDNVVFLLKYVQFKQKLPSHLKAFFRFEKCITSPLSLFQQLK